MLSQSYNKLFLANMCFIGLLSMAGCATNGLSTSSANSDVATTYGLQTNLAPKQLPMPAQPLTHFVLPPANPLTAPANLVLLLDKQNQISAHDQQALQNQANYLVVHPDAAVKLNGFTNANSSPNINIILGWQLLQQIKQQLLQYGVAPKQIEMVSYGKALPLVEGYGKQSSPYNRRVQLVYEDKTS